jgi:hypothetical protein
MMTSAPRPSVSLRTSSTASTCPASTAASGGTRPAVSASRYVAKNTGVARRAGPAARVGQLLSIEEPQQGARAAPGRPPRRRKASDT